MDTNQQVLATLVPDAAARWSDEVALVGEHGRVTWEEVEETTRRLATHLVECGVQPGDRVAVARPKGLESFEAVHAVLRAGAVVVPVDPAAPAPVVSDVLADADVSAVVGEAATIRRIDPWSVSADLRAVVATGETDD